MKPNLAKLSVAVPARYSGGEALSPVKENPALRWVLAFPDIYEIGMSHLGYKIIYSILNSMTDVSCERVFAPWKDEESRLRNRGEALVSLETGQPVNSADVIGFSLQYELSLTNVLQILDLSGLSLLAAERAESAPLVIAGGPLTSNPAPFMDFFDAIFIGDAELAVQEISSVLLDPKLKTATRKKKLFEISRIPGVYVPMLENDVRRSILPDLNDSPVKLDFPVPSIQPVHDRLTFEIQRGCARGCRFCQAGFIYRPIRQKSPEIILEHAEDEIKRTGYDEVSLLSLSSGDYGCLPRLLEGLSDITQRYSASLSLPSLRAETLCEGIFSKLSKGRPVTITIAPEAGSERLRTVINKTGNQDSSFLKAVELAAKNGWNNIKAYFMIGLPTETDEDIEAIVDLCTRARDLIRSLRGRTRLTISVSTFIPKPWTPFQWEAQISMEETRRKQDYLKNRIRALKLDFKYHDAESSFLEGLLSRSGREISGVVLSAYKKGARFDAWTEELKFDLWLEAIKEQNIDSREILSEKNSDQKLPWDFISGFPTRAFLLSEREKSRTMAETTDCTKSACNGCGVCRERKITNVLYTLPEDAAPPPNVFTEMRGWFPVPVEEGTRVPPSTSNDTFHYRLNFFKTGRATLIGHLDLGRVLIRSLKRSGLPLKYSEGFHRSPVIAFADPIPLGIESLVEYIDITLTKKLDASTELVDFIKRINYTLPEGITITKGEFSLKKIPSYRPDQIKYLVEFENMDVLDLVTKGISRFQAGEKLQITKKEKIIFINNFIKTADKKSDNSIDLVISTFEDRTINPYEALQGLSGLPRSDLITSCRIRKESSWHLN